MDHIRIVILILVMLVGGSRANLGLVEIIPDLEPSVNAAIEGGIEPLLKANDSIMVDVRLDRSGALATVVTITNIVNSTIGSVFSAAKDAVIDRTSTPNVVFGRLYKAGVSAEIKLQDAIMTGQVLQSIVKQSISTGVLENLTSLQGQVENLTFIYLKLGAAINTFQLSQNNTRNLTATVTPVLVNKVATALRNISKVITTLGSLFTDIVQDKNIATVYLISINDTINTSITNIIQTVDNFTKSVNEAKIQLAQPIRIVASNIAESYADIIENPEDFNGGNITDLVLFLGLVGNTNLVFSLNSTMNLNTLQDNVNRSLAYATATAANALTNSIRIITDTTSTSDNTTYGPVCSEKYYQKLLKLTPRTSLLSNCLKLEEPSLFIRYKLILSPLLAQLESEASSLGSPRIKSCSSSNGTCSNTYFRGFRTLAKEIIGQFQLIGRLLAAETQSFSTRIGVCANATAADIGDLAAQLLSGYERCLVMAEPVN